MLFQDVIGHDALKDKLLLQFKSGKVSHARLFTGPPGYGPLPLALALAQYMNCTNKQEKDSCGECPSCSKYQKLVHPDLHLVYPVATTPKVTSKPISQHFIAELEGSISSQSLPRFFSVV